MTEICIFLVAMMGSALAAGYGAWAVCRAAARGDAMLAEAYDMGKIAADFERDVLGPQREATSAAFDRALDLEPYRALMEKMARDLAAETDVPPGLALPQRFLAGVDILRDPGWIDDDGFFVSECERR